MKLFFGAVHLQAVHRAAGIVPNFSTYIEMRRETSACRAIFDLIEYSLDLELPGAVVEHPVIVALNNAANDFVTWSNVRSLSTPFLIPSANKKHPGSILV